jgi:hypothetical protein
MSKSCRTDKKCNSEVKVDNINAYKLSKSRPILAHNYSMKISYGWVFIYLIFLSIPDGVFAQFTSINKNSYPVALANAYRFNLNGEVSVPIEFPILQNQSLLNLSHGKYQFLPEKFVISNGTTYRSFLEIDRRPGTDLNLKIKYLQFEIEQVIKKFAITDENQKKELILKYLAKNFKRYMDWINKETEKSIFVWDLPNPNHRLIQEEREKLMNEPIAKVAETQIQHTAVSFEAILIKNKGYCIDMALLASFLLEAFGISHRIVFGAVVHSYNERLGVGHTWIELPDRRILDVAWETLDVPKLQTHPKFKDWLWFGNDTGYQYRYEYDFFPILNLN